MLFCSLFTVLAEIIGYTLVTRCDFTSNEQYLRLFHPEETAVACPCARLSIGQTHAWRADGRTLSLAGTRELQPC